jgi:hypothetical protein
MSEITRFFSWDGNGFMHEDADGDYVLYEDHKAEVERLKALIVSQHEVVQWAADGWPVALEVHEREAIEAIVQEAQEREQREAAATGGTR